MTRGPGGYSFQANPPGAAGGKGKTLDANYKLMVITGLGSALTPASYDLLICREWDMVNNAFKGNDIYVAKDILARRVNVQEFYYDNGDNLKQNYTYFAPTSSDPTYGDNFRLASDGTNSELQVMEQRYYTKDQMTSQNVSVTQALVTVIDLGVPTGVKDPSGKDVTRIESKPVRVWERYATQ